MTAEILKKFIHSITLLAFTACLPHAGRADTMPIQGYYGNYSMTREASGTAWEPESSPMQGMHFMQGGWMGMVQGNANLVYDAQGGARGDEKVFSESMLMVMAAHELAGGTFGLRSMMSLEPLMGKKGYPLLLQTGETANGTTGLVDRQHPHDLFMELAATYSHPITPGSSAFLYVGYPGEPAIGPVTFMHRFSGIDNPSAPIAHHWLDSTHITYGVVTAGYIWRNWKLEGSAFNGREPDEFRWNFDTPRLSSYAGRVSYNPTGNWSLQASHAFIRSPEELEPDLNQHRTSASATYNLPFDDNNWQTTLAWGLDNNSPGRELHSALLESAVRFHDRHTVFARAEWAQKDELFSAPSPLAGKPLAVNELSLGYVYDLAVARHVKMGLGGVGTVYALPQSLTPYYGANPASVMLFGRVALY